MMVVLGFLLGILGLTFIAFARSVTTLIHELGHAIPALLFSKEEVIIYVGDYEAVEDSKVFRWGRLTAYLKFNLFFWNGGFCRHRPIEGFWKNFWVIIGGPLASVILALPLIYLLQEYREVEGLVFLTSVYIVSAFLDFIVNLIPSKKPIKVAGGATTYNDGYQLLALFLTPKGGNSQ